MEKLKISHTILYFKNWYEKTNLVEDLIKTLDADGWVVSNKYDVYRTLLSIATKYSLIFNLKDIIINANPKVCGSVGYITKHYTFAKDDDKDIEYDYETAIIYAIGFELHLMESNNFVIVQADENVLPLRKRF